MKGVDRFTDRMLATPQVLADRRNPLAACAGKQNLTATQREGVRALQPAFYGDLLVTGQRSEA